MHSGGGGVCVGGVVWMLSVRWQGVRFVAAGVFLLPLVIVPVTIPVTALADTLEWALVQAYQNNPQINSHAPPFGSRRKCTAGVVWLPSRFSWRRLGEQYLDVYSRRAATVFECIWQHRGHQLRGDRHQTLLGGFQTANRTRGGPGFSGARKSQLTEHTILLAAVTPI